MIVVISYQICTLHYLQRIKAKWDPFLCPDGLITKYKIYYHLISLPHPNKPQLAAEVAGDQLETIFNVSRNGVYKIEMSASSRVGDGPVGNSVMINVNGLKQIGMSIII